MDSASLTALLEQLEASPAWQELSTGTTSVVPPNPSLQLSQTAPSTGQEIDDSHAESPSTCGASVAELLSKLTSSTYSPPNIDSTDAICSSYSVSSSAPLTENRKEFTFLRALPEISKLAEKPSFISAVQMMKADQDDLERRLWHEREAIYEKYNEKLRVAAKRTQVIGALLSEHEIKMTTDAFKKEIAKFDCERVLPAWDGLVSRQQHGLEQVDLPTMFVTDDSQDRERQQQVIKVLDTIVGPKAT